MSSLLLPVSMVVVTHDVDEIEDAVHGWNIVGSVDDGLRRADGGRQDEVVALERGF